MLMRKDNVSLVFAVAACLCLWAVTFAGVCGISIVTSRAEDELVPVARIKSPDTGSTYAYGETKKRMLYWSEKKQELSAQITFTDAKYNAPGQINEETIEFRLPGVRFDKDKKQFYVIMADTNQRIIFAERKKAFMGSSIVPVRNAIIRVIKTGSSVNVVADIYKPEEVAKEEKAASDEEKKAAAAGEDGKEVKVKSLFDK